MIGSLKSEYRKVIGLREWGLVALVPIVLGMASAAVAFPLLRAFRSEDTTGNDPYATVMALATPIALAVLFAGLFGALNVGSEFRHRTLAIGFVTAQRRDLMIGSKLAVTVGFGLALCLVVEIAVLPVLLAFGGDDFHIDGSLFARLGSTFIAVVAWSLIGCGLTMLTRSATVAAVGMLTWYIIGEFVVRFLLGAIGADGFARILPVSATAGSIVNAGNPDPVDSLPSWTAAVLFMLMWAILIGGAGWAVIRQRDVES